MDRPAGGAVPHSDRGAGFRRPRESHRRALGIGLAVSAVVHLAGLYFYPRVSDLEVPNGPVLRIPSVGVPVQGMQVIELIAVDATEDPDRPLDPEDVRPLQGPAVRPGAPRVGDPAGPGLVAPGPTAAERLRPDLRDPRLWAPLGRNLNDLTLEQIQELELTGRIAEWQDSLSTEAERQRALTDWTTTDGEGRRWGVSEGKLHLGDVTLPLPFQFGTPIGRRDEFNRRAWEWEEIQRGSATGELRDSWKDRARAIRERRDRERAAQARPDTSGVRR